MSNASKLFLKHVIIPVNKKGSIWRENFVQPWIKTELRLTLYAVL